MTRWNVRLIVGGVFAGVSVILLGVAVALSVSAAHFARTAVRTEGTVVDLDYVRSQDHGTVAYPSVTFVGPADGREYTFRDSTGSNPPAYAVGERVPVLFDPAHPGDARIDSTASRYLGPLICGGLGIVFGAIGAVLLILERRRVTRCRWLRDHGQERWVDVAHVGPDYSVRVNGRHPFVVHASWRDERTGRIHTACSDHLWQDPGPLLGDQPVRVLFDPADPDRNLVDL